MIRKHKNIEAQYGWSPMNDFTVCGACYAEE
jgi:hypothetical protein